MERRRVRSDASCERWSGWALLVALLVGVVLGCSQNAPRENASAASAAPIASGIYVHSAWAGARRFLGHRVHVVERSIPCASCHDLSQGKLGGISPSRCAKCHEKEARLQHAMTESHARFGPDSLTDCTVCHAFKPPPDSTAKFDPFDVDAGPPLGPKPGECIRCHAQAQGDTPAVKVHATSNCLGCHRPHADARPMPGDCKQCHADVTTTHAAAGRSTIAVCTTCHQHLHAPASAAREACPTCHATHEPVIPATALFAGGHTACVNCHEPHAFSAASKPCRSCHGGVAVLGAPEVLAHTVCTNCHQPHDVRGTPAAACSGCHRTLHPDHPAAAGGCVGCHDPHPNLSTPAAASVTTVAAIARPCTSCHQKLAGADHELHAGTACTSCHAPHQFALQLDAHPGCPSCHQNELTRTFANEGHHACQGCHAGLPHHPEHASTTCTGCHTHEHQLLSSHHTPCTSCHEPHAGALAKPCGSCHAAEQKSAPSGHQACTNCHEPHSGNRVVACPSCHTREAATPHGQLGGACTRCHRPHGPNGPAAPPACTTCHQPATLPGLHAVGEHQACTRCHTGHGEMVTAQREACLSCHSERRNHFPNASRCSSCHLFAAAKGR